MEMTMQQTILTALVVSLFAATAAQAKTASEHRHANEGAPGGFREIAEQQCLRCAQRHCGAARLVELRQRRDGIGNRWSLICDLSTKRSGLPEALTKSVALHRRTLSAIQDE
jgi:hypothetical protein